MHGIRAAMGLVLFMLAGCASHNALVISRQGVFASGGRITEARSGTYDETTNWLDLARPGNSAHVDHASVIYQIPRTERGNPIVFLHGYGQSRLGWMGTPDGRAGWQDMFLRKGHPVFLVDQPRRGSAGASERISEDALDRDGDFYLPGDQAWYTHFRIGRRPPEHYPGSQFPEGEAAQNQFFRQMTVNTGSFDEELFGRALSAVLADVHELTGKKSVYITHSQGSRVGWQTDPEYMAAIIAIEPGGTPEIGSDRYRALFDAHIPIALYFGDYIDTGDEDIQSTHFWRAIRDEARAFVEAYQADGGSAVLIDLPEIGIKGNSHFLFQELNNEEIADHISDWLRTQGLRK